MPESSFFESANLRTGRGWPLAWLLRRGQRDQGYTDDNEPGHGAQQTSAFARNMNCQHGHNHAVSEARPRCKGDQAAIRRWITYCHQQENAKREIQAGASCHRRSPTYSVSIKTSPGGKCQPKTAIPPTPGQPSAPVLDSWCPPPVKRSLAGNRRYASHRSSTYLSVPTPAAVPQYLATNPADRLWQTRSSHSYPR